MPAFSAYAPGKIILFGEHAVVYGRPAIAVPVTQVRARAQVEADLRAPAGQIHVLAPDVGLDSQVDDLPADHPIAVTLRLAQDAAGIDRLPACKIRIASTIPVASGLGSGAAVAVALIRAMAAFWGHPLPDDRVSALVYEVEKLHHGTPSGIDNTVITYSSPVFFIKGDPIQLVQVGAPFTIVIGDTAISSPTASSVAAVRRAWQSETDRIESIFDRIAECSLSARRFIQDGQAARLGVLMDTNHALLQELAVSSPKLDTLVTAARRAGALGAKLSGGGLGGNMIALVTRQNAEEVSQALRLAGAKQTWISEVR